MWCSEFYTYVLWNSQVHDNISIKSAWVTNFIGNYKVNILIKLSLYFPEYVQFETIKLIRQVVSLNGRDRKLFFLLVSLFALLISCFIFNLNSSVNPFHATDSFLYPQKTLETGRMEGGIEKDQRHEVGIYQSFF